MSKETDEWLNTQTLIGFTDKRGKAWHHRESAQGAEPNHYAGAVPVEDVRRRLFDWEALTTPLEYTVNGTQHIDNTRQVIVRSDKPGQVLGTFKSGYKIHQYDEWLMKNVESILDADLQVGSAGLLKGGALAWVQVEMEDTISVEGVEFRPFLTAATSFDGSLASTYLSGAQVVVCDNTLSAALGERGGLSLKVKHSVNSLGKITDVREALNIVHSVADDFSAQIIALTQREVTDKEFAAFVALYTASEGESASAATIAKRRTEELAMLWNADERVKPWTGTAFGVVQAVNTHTHHVATVRGAGRTERNMERMVRGQWDTHDKGTLALLDKVQGR